ncbi:hypothetical protein [Flavisolibacter tropicus]|uniref:Lipoprotein n=1 Tax=Flavisolibacter tropicus TaxID=1492898 RepID=A0A172TXS7_9BACT|nr:hypothetical protein [Flavisolibacter tropicus]ANE51778.1 hypothetical protein SY85_16045 [Flavisolibacter tropicus]
MKKLILPIGLLWLVACSNNADQKATPTESSKGTTVVTDELPDKDELAPVTQVFTNLDSNFNTGSFYPSGIDSVQYAQLVKIDSGSMKEFIPYLIYNADSSLAADPYSYNYIIHQQKGKTKVSEAGPDVEIGLVDLKQNSRRRLWFSGPSSLILDAKWKSKNELLLGGVEQIDTSGYQPFVLVINVTNNHIDRWQSDEMITGQLNDVLKQKLEAQLNATKTTRAF